MQRYKTLEKSWDSAGNQCHFYCKLILTLQDLKTPRDEEEMERHNEVIPRRGRTGSFVFKKIKDFFGPILKPSNCFMILIISRNRTNVTQQDEVESGNQGFAQSPVTSDTYKCHQFFPIN